MNPRSDSTYANLGTILLNGELGAWPAIAEASDLPLELRSLARDERPDDPGAMSESLRRICVGQPVAADSVLLAAASVLRLTAIGHDDPAWGDLLPRWLVPSLPPEVRGVGLLALALNARDRLCADDYADLMDEALLLLPEDAPLRHAHIYQYALYLGLRGMLQRLKDVIELPRPGDQEPDVNPALLAECFYDAVCCGRSAQAAFLERRLAAAPEAAWQLGLFHMHRVFIPVFSAVSSKTPLPEQSEVASLPLIRALLGADPDLLDEFESDDATGEVSPLLGFDALRIALAKRDHSTARRILERRMLGPGHHWLDDLFLARLLLLEDRPREAGVAFAKVEAAAQRYGGIERLEIELRLSAELSRHDCCRLGLLAGGQAPSQGQAAAPDEITEALLAGTSKAATTLRDRLQQLVSEAPQRMLILGPEDGSRNLVADCLHDRLGATTCVRLSASCCLDVGWTGEMHAALAQPGTVIIDDLERLDAAGQARLLAAIREGHVARLLACAGPALSIAASSGQWRRDLFWLLAADTIRVPRLDERSADLVAIAASWTTGSAPLRFEASAAAALTTTPFVGGWAEFAAFACRLVRRASNGMVTARSVTEALADLHDLSEPAG
jgi:hypothetical protein